MNRAQPGTGRRIVIALLVATAVVHAVLLTRMWAGDQPVLAALDGAFAVAALVAAGAVLLRTEPAVLLGAAVVGGVGVAMFLVPGLVAIAGGRSFGGWLDPWAFGALLLDALVVRVAVFTLRSAPTASR